MKPLISVIVPIYKVEKYINKCVDSIINQTYTNIEIILVDDGSPDNCGRICEDYKKNDNRIVVIHKENGGLSDARNVGIDNAKGEYICFVDSDDYISDDYVEYLYNLIEKYNCKMSVCAHKSVYDSGTIISQEDNREFCLSKTDAIERMLYFDGFDVSAWAKMYKTELFDKDIRYPKGMLFEDAATTYKLMDKCDNIGCGLQSKYFYLIRQDSIVTSKFSMKKCDLIAVTKEMGDYLCKKYPSLKDAVIRREVYANFSTLRQMVNSKKRYKEEEKKIVQFIRNNSTCVIKNKKAPKRDKFAIITLLLGVEFFKFSWNKYLKFTGRK